MVSGTYWTSRVRNEFPVSVCLLTHLRPGSSSSIEIEKGKNEIKQDPNNQMFTVAVPNGRVDRTPDMVLRVPLPSKIWLLLTVDLTLSLRLK